MPCSLKSEVPDKRAESAPKKPKIAITNFLRFNKTGIEFYKH
jgi:hypothetical protein